MGIWGHEKVLVEKDPKNKVWRVYTVQRALLVEIPWADAYKEFPHAPDYASAVATCQADPETRLTNLEAASVLYGAGPPPDSSKDVDAPGVIRVDFKRKRRL